MGSKEILPNFNVLYFFLLFFTFCIPESDLVNQPNEGDLESTEPNIPVVEFLEGYIIDKRFIDKESSKIVSIITKEMIPQLFERFQHPKLTFTKETWKPKNCEMDKYWSIQLIFDKRRDVEPHDTATLTMMLDDVFRIYRNISRVEYDFSKAIFERESVKIMICFQNVTENANHSTKTNSKYNEANNSRYKRSTSSSAENLITSDESTTKNNVDPSLLADIVKDTIIPIFESFYPGYNLTFKITFKYNDFFAHCDMEVFDISFEIHDAKLSLELIKFLEGWLWKLPGMYNLIMAAYLTECFQTKSIDAPTRYQIELKVSEPDEYCRKLRNELGLPNKRDMIPGSKELVEKFVRENILPIFQTIYSSDERIEFEITQKEDEVAGFCPMQVFEISIVIYGAFPVGALMTFVENRLQKLPEMYDYIMAACLLNRSDHAYYHKITRYPIRLKVSKQDDNCKILKGEKKIKCI